MGYSGCMERRAWQGEIWSCVLRATIETATGERGAREYRARGLLTRERGGEWICAVSKSLLD